MRKALAAPAVLFEWFTPAEGISVEALIAMLRSSDRLRGATARRFCVAGA